MTASDDIIVEKISSCRRVIEFFVLEYAGILLMPVLTAEVNAI